MNTKALFTGSFDPLTMGHFNIIERASAFADEVTVGIIDNPSKNTMFSLEERECMIRGAVADLDNVKVDHFSGLLADYVNANDYNIIIRGLRNSTDFEYEYQMAQMNAMLFNGKTETVFMMTDTEYSFISSSMVKEVFNLGGTVEGLVPDIILDSMRKK